MKPLESEFSPDLTWMLTSGQVGDEILLEAFYHEYYEDISRLCLAALDDKRLAQKATQMVFGSAVINRYRYKDGITIRYWFFQLALETIIKMYNTLEVKRTITANLPIKMKSTNYGDSTPDSSWEAEIWLTLDQLQFEKRLLALSLYYLEWHDAEIISIFNFSPEDLSLNKRYLNSVLLPFRIDNSSNFNASLEERIIQSLSKRWPISSIPVIEPDAFIRQVANQIRITRLKNRFAVSSKEFLLTAIIIILAALSIWGYNRFFPEALPSTPEPQSEIISQQTVLTVTPTNPNILSPAHTSQTPDTKNSEINQYFYTVKPEDTLTSIARQYNLGFDALRRVNRIPDNTKIAAGQRLWFYTGLGNSDLSLAKYLDQIQGDISQEEFHYIDLPLIRNLEAIYPDGSLLWLTGYVIDYGPISYIGPPKIESVQAWLTPEAALFLIGDEQQELQEVWLLTNQYQFMATPGKDGPWAHSWQPVNPDSPYFESLVHFSNTLARKFDFSPVIMKYIGEEVIGNSHNTTEYDVQDSNSVLRERIWVDNPTKIVLRRQLFEGTIEPASQTEILINQFVEGNISPTGLLDPRIPWRGGFAKNQLAQPAASNAESFTLDLDSGKQRILSEEMTLPTVYMDLSKSQLTFQYPPSFTSMHRIPVELFAEDQLLGIAELGNPWTMICDRSANGNILAYVSQPGDVPDQASRLQLVDLYNPASMWHILPLDLGVQMFAFSPDGKQLAVFGHPGRYVEGTLLVIDVVESTYITLGHLGEASSLVWSPDSHQIAIIARYQSSTFLEEIIVYDLNTGEITSRQPLDFSNSQPAHWPTEEWGIEFPVEMGGLSKCAQASQESP